VTEQATDRSFLTASERVTLGGDTRPCGALSLEGLVSPEHMEQKRDEVLDLIRS